MTRGKTKCRRADCGHTAKYHRADDSCTECDCSSFIAPEDVAASLRKAPSNAESLYREAFTAGIKEAEPDQPFVVTGARIGSIVGPVAAQHAPGVTGAELLAWIRESAREFREATAHEPQYWGGWQPFNWAKWKNMGPRKAGKQTMLQPAPDGIRVREVGRKA